MHRDSSALLAIYAHPDDEVLGAGGTLAMAAGRGAHVAIVIATRGEAGEIQRPGTATPETLPQVREEEMRCSARALGADELIFLDYRDSGMEGTEDNQHPDALINARPEDVVGQLARIIRRLQPDVVLTFEPYGGYGHPDHRAINRFTLVAMKAAADPARFPSEGDVWDVPRLFYHLLPRSLFREIRDRVAARGGETRDYDDMLQQARPEAWPEDQIHAVVDVSGYLDQKWAAWNCHRTQFGPNSRFRRLPDEEMKELLSTEHFALARPAPNANTRLDDLFAPLS